MTSYIWHRLDCTIITVNLLSSATSCSPGRFDGEESIVGVNNISSQRYCNKRSKVKIINEARFGLPSLRDS